MAKPSARPPPLELATPGEIAVGVIIGRTPEFYDFFVYGIASVLVFPKHVFPFLDPLAGTLCSFVIFALAFVVRPFGTALFLLGGSTAALAFLPSYRDVGAASVLLLMLLRMGQGVALGDTWDGLASLLALRAPAGRGGWYAMLPQLGAPLRFMLASGLFAFFLTSLSPQDFLDWGWRYPFFVAFAINVVALFARLGMVVAPEYSRLFESRALEPRAVRETLRAEGHNVVIGAFAPLASFALFHTVKVFPLSWVFLYTRDDPARFLIVETLGAVVGIAAILASGVLADRFGRRTLLSVTAGAIAAFVFLGFALLGLSFGQSSGSVASSFAMRVRYTGSALTPDFAWLFGAGFAPLVALGVNRQPEAPEP